MLITQSLFVVTIVLLIIIGGVVYSKDKNKIRSVRFLDRIDKIIILVMTLIYAGMSFYHFASFYPYNHPWNGNKTGDSLTLNFIKPVNLGRIDYFVGFDKGTYSISAIQDNKKIVIITAAETSSAKYRNIVSARTCIGCFLWQDIHINDRQLAHVTSLTFTIESGSINFHKFTLVDKDNKIISNYQLLLNNKEYSNLHIIGKTQNDLLQNNWEKSTVFDELYYVSSAYEYLHGRPPDVSEHPQLAMLLIALGLSIFGLSSFGWRILDNCSGILLVPFMYIFTKRIFRSRVLAILATFLMIIDPMHYLITKLALLDPFVTLFLVLEYYFLWCYFESRVNGISFRVASRYLLISGVFFGLAVSSKWNGLFSSLAILYLLLYCELFKCRDSATKLAVRVIISFVYFIFLPILIYVITYIPVANILHVRKLFDFVVFQQVLTYQGSSHVARGTIWYGSYAWQWLLNQGVFPLNIWPYYPIFTNQNFDLYITATKLQLPVFFVNPLLSGMFFIAIPVLTYQFIKNKDHRSIFILLAVLAQFVPYIFFQRVSFIYYFYGVEPFLILGVCYVFYSLYQIKYIAVNKVILKYIILNLLVWVWFIPIIFNLMLPYNYIMTVFRSIAYITLLINFILLIGFYLVIIKMKKISK